MQPRFDHEKLEVYQTALAFIRWVTPLLDETRHLTKGSLANTRDQLDRASLSIVLNIAEGNGKSGNSRKAFFEIARGSATECAACLDVLLVKEALDEARQDDGKRLLVRIVQMLTKMIQVLQQRSEQVREDEIAYEVMG